MRDIQSPLQYYGVVPESNEAALLRLLLTTAVETIKADEGSLLLRDEPTGDLRFAMTIGDPDRERRLIGERVPVGRGIVQEAVATQAVQIGAPTFRDIEQTHRETGGPEAVIAAPMISGSRVIGVLTGVSFVRGRRFGQDDAKLYGRLATIAAVLIEQHQRISGMQRRQTILTTGTHPAQNRELGLIDQTLSRIVERDPEALAHIAAIVTNFEAAVRR
jgi:GAF domain-containing protein